MKLSHSTNGFTLIELMIVVAIIGLLAAVAIPSYQDSIRKGKRAEGRTALTELLQQQERFATQRNTYASFAAGATTGDATAFKTFSGDTKAKAAYLLGARVCPINNDLKICVQVFATPVSTFSDPQVGELTIETTGKKDCNGTTPSLCWK
jgi:type IV pilus assembly protein PilE